MIGATAGNEADDGLCKVIRVLSIDWVEVMKIGGSLEIRRSIRRATNDTSSTSR